VSGLLQRLAGQAVGAQASDTPRIRPAASVHAQVPMSLPRDNEDARAMPALAPETPRLQTQDSRTASPAQRGLPQEFTTLIQSVGTAREFAPQPGVAGPIETRVSAPLGSREPPNKRTSHDLVEMAPPPLLEEVQPISALSAITPVAPPPLAVSVAPSDSRAEPTEVHVHIGRIEVIAAPEPVPPKKNRATPARNTLPLADYLARRRRS